MNWINNVVRPKIRSFLTTKREVPDNLWKSCPLTGQMVFHKDLEANQFVFPGSEYHERMSAGQRFEHLFDDGAYEKVVMPTAAVDPLKFRDGRRYTDRLKEAKSTTELDDAILIGEGTLDGRNIVAAVQDFRFMAGSLGMAAGEAIIAGMLHAVAKKTPFILFAASGGARMQEGILSLMQMPRTTIAVQRLRDARLPYIVVLTDPTTGGVTASYAMLGDIHIAEPNALICFAGPRVIQQTIREQLPEGFQRSEYLLEHGMIDMVVHRHELRETLSRLCRLMMSPVEKAKAKPADLKKHMNGSTYSMKKSPSDDAALPSGVAGETSSDGIIEAEPVEGTQRFKASGKGAGIQKPSSGKRSSNGSNKGKQSPGK